MLLAYLGLFVAVALVRYAIFFVSVEPSAEEWQKAMFRLTKRVDVRSIVANSKNVVKYYSETTFRDYRWLAMCTGRTEMHTDLKDFSPMTFVERRVKPKSRILELGCGKGDNISRLLNKFGDIQATGLDATPEHVFVAKKKLEGHADIRLQDFVSLPPPEEDEFYDVAYAVETMCYVPADKIGEVLASVASRLSPGGRFVVVDAFRKRKARRGDAAAMLRMAEVGFRVPAFETTKKWKKEAELYGLRLEKNVDLTALALPYWTLGWRIARMISFFPRRVAAYVGASPEKRTETLANFLAVCSVAPALAEGAAEYRAIIFVKEGDARRPRQRR